MQEFKKRAIWVKKLYHQFNLYIKKRKSLSVSLFVSLFHAKFAKWRGPVFLLDVCMRSVLLASELSFAFKGQHSRP